jgi:hypothetical protein
MAKRMVGTVTLTFDTEATTYAITARALHGLQRAATFTLGRAKYHAPVRALFKRRRNERGAAMPRSWRYIRTESQYERFRASQSKRIGMNLPIEGGAMAREQAGGTFESAYWRHGQGAERGGLLERSSVTRMRTLGRAGTQFSGFSNSLFPVLKQGGVRATGDFRADRGYLVNRPKPAYFKQGPNMTMAAYRSKRADVSSFISSRGRWEMRNRRSLFEGRFGGRLRGEIRLIGPVVEEGTIWMYVESPTPYGVHQEFGSKRNRPHPFLRPALYESRQVLRTEVRKALETGPAMTKNERGQKVFRSDYGGDSRTSSSKRVH